MTVVSKILALVVIFSSLNAFAIPDKKPVVFTKKALRQELFDTLNYPARVEAKMDAVILSETDGLVTKVISSIGQSVSRKTTLLVVQQTDPVFKYAPVAVKSPIQGYISQLEVTEGARVTKGQRLASVTNPASLKISVEVPAEDLNLVKTGMLAEMQVTTSDQPLTLRVRGVSPVIDSATGTATAELEVVDAKILSHLRPGLIARVSLKANLRQGFSVPEDALIYRDDKTFLRLVDKGAAKKIEVKLGRKSRGRVEILNGLSDGVEVVERSSGYINDGDLVEVQTEKSSQGS